jgi:hypothetical protein
LRASTRLQTTPHKPSLLTPDPAPLPTAMTPTTTTGSRSPRSGVGGLDLLQLYEDRHREQPVSGNRR